MRAIVCEQLGDPTQPLGSGVLRLKDDQPAPEIKPGCIRVRVTAASLNFPDALQVKVRGRQLSKEAAAAAGTMRKEQWCIGIRQAWYWSQTYYLRYTTPSLRALGCCALHLACTHWIDLGQYQVKPKLRICLS
jgi:hypothetical protein